ncbi:hypothetical protein [Haloferula sp. BvORR071]|uniref:hypothetical protein n=1 Tax=Haloferula sp. BvORR071 TaxID=1396141 RepID=UPI002240EB41|nr:hypothetical protein [Haloferula sp. BvORR071]
MNFARLSLLLMFQGSLALGQEIHTDQIALGYDAASGTFSATDRITGRCFVSQGRLDRVEPGAVATMKETTDPVFGLGSQLAIPHGTAGETRLELYPGLPFLLVRQVLANTGDEELDVRHAVPATFALDLGKDSSGLVTMGTAGLKPVAKNPGSYLFLTLADPATREGVVAGWLTHERGDGVLFSNIGKLGAVEFKAQIDYGHLRIPAGKSETLETLLIGHFADARVGEELFADVLKRQHHIQLRPQVNGYCTWYSEVGGLTDPKRGAGALNEKDIVTLADFAAKELKPFGFSFVQIDDEWQDGATNPDGSRVNGPRRGFTRHKPDGPYPSGMAATAKNLAARGLTTGIWFLPFAANHQDQDFPKEWFMQRRDGMPYETTWGGTSFDLTRPEVQDYLRQLAGTIRGWGIKYFKMDGLWTGACAEQVYVNDGYLDDDLGNNKPFHDPKVTNIEALRLGLKTLREGAGPDVFFSGCNTSQNMRSLGAVIGLVDSMRIGPDNGFEWQDWRKETMHFEGGGIITGPVRASRLYFLHGRVWWNDPDPAYVRPAVKLEHARLLASWIAVAGQFNLSSDWLPGLPPERLEILKRCMPSHAAQARPIDYFDTPMPSQWLLTDPSQSSRRDVLGLYNWDSEDKTLACDTAKAGLKAGTTYHAFDFWANAPAPDFVDRFEFAVPKESCRILALRAVEDHPVLVSTSRHVTQGIVDVTGETWSGSTLSATSRVVAGDAYELRIAGLKNGWKPGEVRVSAEDQAANVSIAPLPSEDGWLRVKILSKDSREVKWTVGFGK